MQVSFIVIGLGYGLVEWLVECETNATLALAQHLLVSSLQ